MRTPVRSVLLGALVAVCALGFGAVAQERLLPFATNEASSGRGSSEAAALTLPTDFRDAMQHYAIVDRGDGRVHDIYVNDLALETWLAERRLPDGTVFAIESFAPHPEGARTDDGRLAKGESDHDVHVSMKSTRWEPSDAITTTALLFGAETDGGTWRMGGFDPRSGLVTRGLDIAECHECHVDRRAEDFILSRGLLDRYARSGEPAYISFDCEEREICFGTP